MPKRFVTIWFRYLPTDWHALRQSDLRRLPFVLASPSRGRMLITASNYLAQVHGIDAGMAVADARALLPSLRVLDHRPALSASLLHRLAEWCIRYTPSVAIDLPDGLILDATGCSHFWGGDAAYVKDISSRLSHFGYDVRAAMADTIGTAWAVTRFAQDTMVDSGGQTGALLSLPPAALRLETDTVERLEKLGLLRLRDFMSLPRAALRRRFGQHLIQRLDQAIGNEEEPMQPVLPVVPYQERLPCLEPIVTATGIEIALQRLLDTLCLRLQREEKGLRAASFKGYRADGKIEKVDIGTLRPSHNARHLFKLFESKLSGIRPASGIELFLLEAQVVETHCPVQEKLWEASGGLGDNRLSELLDRLSGRIGAGNIHRYLPDERYWPERSFKLASSLQESSPLPWKIDRPRPLQLLAGPERIEVTAPVPDYPPMLFRYKGKLHTIKKADGPERVEQEWWLQQGEHRDYYHVEDEEGCRYWLFRLGHYAADKNYHWFIHGFFA